MPSRVAKMKAFPRKRKGVKYTAGDKTGVVYIGHMPQGFEEKEMHKYFTQFGKVKRVKVSRTLKNGKSKGYGFVQFENTEVAKIAAETMNNYIMFQKSLKAHVVDQEKVHDTLFKKTGKTFFMATAKNRDVAIKKFNKVQKEADNSTLRKRRRKQAAQLRLFESVGYQFSGPQRETSSLRVTPKSLNQRSPTQKSPAVKTPASSAQKQRTPKPKSPKSGIKEHVEPTKTSASSAQKQRTPKPKTPKLGIKERVEPTEQATLPDLQFSLKKSKTPKTTNKKVVKMAATPIIIRATGDESSDPPSDEEISFKTPTGKASSTRKITASSTSARKVFPKTPLPLLQKSGTPEVTEDLQTPSRTTSSKKLSTPHSKLHIGSGPRSGTKKAKSPVSDASPALHPKVSATTSRKSYAEPPSKKGRPTDANQKPEETTPAKPKKSPKFSPRVTRSVIKKKKSTS